MYMFYKLILWTFIFGVYGFFLVDFSYMGFLFINTKSLFGIRLFCWN